MCIGIGGCIAYAGLEFFYKTSYWKKKFVIEYSTVTTKFSAFQYAVYLVEMTIIIVSRNLEPVVEEHILGCDFL
jgi:hypothetical protein